MGKTTRETQIRRLAEQLLGRAEVSTPPVPVERIALLCGARVRYVPFEGELSGLLFQEKKQVIIGVNALHAKTRQRFTIAHELGHLELHHHDALHVDRDFRVRRRDAHSSDATDGEEIAANTFAAELLMPARMLAQDLAGHEVDYEDDTIIRELADRYKVSLQAMVFRLMKLGYIPPLTDGIG